MLKVAPQELLQNDLLSFDNCLKGVQTNKKIHASIVEKDMHSFSQGKRECVCV